MKKIVIIFLVFLLVPLSACSTTATGVNGYKMVRINTFAVHPKANIFSFDTTIIRSRQEVVDFLDKNKDKFIWHSDIQPSINVFAKFILNYYDDNFFATNHLVLFGALRDINNGIFYSIRNYNLENSTLHMEVDRIDQGGGRVIVYNILLFEIFIGQYNVDSVDIKVFDG